MLSVSKRRRPPTARLRLIDSNAFWMSIFARSEKNQYARLYFFLRASFVTFAL